jgi:NNP family nitrate/nitrite transporter-like MFS transporter
MNTNPTITNKNITKNTILIHSTIAFFITFVIWFNLPPLALEMGLSIDEIKKLLLINIALTIPARIFIGFLVDRFGSRIVYTVLLNIIGILAILFTFATTYEWMAFIRFLQGVTGAGFVVGIRLISEWYDHKKIGLAEGVYGGWGNFGAAAASLVLPVISGYLGGWQFAMITSGLLAIVYSFIFYRSVIDLPTGAIFHRPTGSFLLPTAKTQDLIISIIMTVIIYLAISLIIWRLDLSLFLYIIVLGLMAYHIFNIIKNHGMPKGGEYKMSQIGILSFAYAATFGSELTAVSILPLYFYETFHLSVEQAGIVASSYAFMNLVSRASGGSFADKYGRKLALSLFLLLTGIGYIFMANMSEGSLLFAIIVMMSASFMVQAGEGAVFASVPLIKKSLTGQISGMAGSFGNIGAVFFLSLYMITSAEIVFYTLGATAFLVGLMAFFFFEEPGEMTEVMPDGTVVMISH